MTTATTPAAPSRPVAQNRAGASAAPTRISVAIRYLLLIVSLAAVLIPVYVLIITSFKGPADADPSRTWYLPQVWDATNWGRAWDALAAPIGRTFALVIPSSILSAILGSMNGFVLSRWRFPGANTVFTLILFGVFIPYQAVMIPLLKIVLSIGLPQGIPTLILAHVVYGIPVTTLIFRNYYESVPQELIEASRVDGAGMLRTYFSVVLPISIPSFVVVLIWQFTAAWNDFLFALFLTNTETGPVTLSLNNLANASIMADYGGSMAGALLASAPTLIVYILLGKYFVGGLMSGSVKG
ncbi:MAG: carbohydrate ABC transporter permease [Bowdeniella nasicola]|nr:carbohydrate ABC transporter permease [Bowdeniella nasicola]